jgi:hypothetical protein
MLPGGKTTKPSTFTSRTARGFLVEKAFVMRTINFAHDLDCLAARRVYPSKRTVGKEIRQCTSHGREELPNILVGQYWPGRSLKALSDQLAKQAVLLADARHLDVPAESKRVPGVGHELHPQAFRSHPEMTGHRRNTLRCAEHFLPGVSSSQRQATKI